jgi:hypothetical protein
MIISLFCRMKARFWLVILLLNDWSSTNCRSLTLRTIQRRTSTWLLPEMHGFYRYWVHSEICYQYHC